MKAEAEDNVERLRHHVCLALFAGNNEDYQVSTLFFSFKKLEGIFSPCVFRLPSLLVSSTTRRTRTVSSRQILAVPPLTLIGHRVGDWTVSLYVFHSSSIFH